MQRVTLGTQMPGTEPWGTVGKCALCMFVCVGTSPRRADGEGLVPGDRQARARLSSFLLLSAHELQARMEMVGGWEPPASWEWDQTGRNCSFLDILLSLQGFSVIIGFLCLIKPKRVLEYALNEYMFILLRSNLKAWLKARLYTMSQSLLPLALVLLRAFLHYLWHRYRVLTHHIRFNKKTVLLQKAFKISVYLNTMQNISLTKAEMLIKRTERGKKIRHDLDDF